MKKIKGNLITLAREGKFDVIAHGVNCFCIQGAGIAKQMQKEFDTLSFKLEKEVYKGDYNKLGQIDFKKRYLEDGRWVAYPDEGGRWVEAEVTVVNAYTQYNLGKDARPDALRMILDKINHQFKGKKIGLPYIGAGIGGLNPAQVEVYIKNFLRDCDVTLVEYDSKR